MAALDISKFSKGAQALAEQVLANAKPYTENRLVFVDGAPQERIVRFVSEGLSLVTEPRKGHEIDGPVALLKYVPDIAKNERLGTAEEYSAFKLARSQAQIAARTKIVERVKGKK